MLMPLLLCMESGWNLFTKEVFQRDDLRVRDIHNIMTHWRLVGHPKEPHDHGLHLFCGIGERRNNQKKSLYSKSTIALTTHACRRIYLSSIQFQGRIRGNGEMQTPAPPTAQTSTTQQHNTMQHIKTMKCNAIQCNAVQCSALHCNWTQCSATQHNVTWHTTPPDSTPLHSTVQ